MAGTRIIPLTIPTKNIEALEALMDGSRPVLSMKPYQHLKVGSVVTGSEVYSGLIKDQFDETIGAKGAVHADRLAYRAALLPAWAEARGIDLPPAQRTWLAELGALWPDVRAAESTRADGALHPLQHPAHDRAVVRSLSKWSPEEQCDESGDGDDSSDDDDTRAARRKRRRCTSSVAAAAAAADDDDDDDDDDDESSESWTL